jgi:SAM-dependent methyltransferase
MKLIKNLLKKIPLIKRWKEKRNRKLNNQYERDDFVIAELLKIPAGKLILDAGCGSQRYRENCAHLVYKGQDFGQYSTDTKKMMGSSGLGGEDGYQYGTLDYVGDIWDIKEQAGTFDAILCTEVFEHIPHPIETLKEFSRLLKKDGKLILTAPSNCLRHMDPYFFYTGFTDRWYEKFLHDHGFKIEAITAVGDYYSWLAVEMARTSSNHSFFAKLALKPAFWFFYHKQKTQTSIDTLCMGYHVVATKI